MSENSNDSIVANLDRLGEGLKAHGVAEPLVDTLLRLCRQNNADTVQWLDKGLSPEDVFADNSPVGTFTQGQVHAYHTGLMLMLHDALSTFLGIYTAHKIADMLGQSDELPAVDDVIDVPRLGQRVAQVVEAYQAIDNYVAENTAVTITDDDLNALLGEAAEAEVQDVETTVNGPTDPGPIRFDAGAQGA